MGETEETARFLSVLNVYVLHFNISKNQDAFKLNQGVISQLEMVASFILNVS